MDKKKINLDELKKENVFQVPERYFDELPGVIQSKVSGHQKERSTVVSWNTAKWALPLVTVAVVIALNLNWFTNNSGTQDIDALLSDIHSSELVFYLEQSELTTDELISTIDPSYLEHGLLEEEEIDLLKDIDEAALIDIYGDINHLEDML